MPAFQMRPYGSKSSPRTAPGRGELFYNPSQIETHYGLRCHTHKNYGGDAERKKYIAAAETGEAF